MDASSPWAPGRRTSGWGDVLIEDTVVAEVGVGLRARDAEQIDATDTIVMPGFVDTHRHAWTSLFRNVGDRASDGRPPARPARLADHFRPEDVYAATLIGLLGAAEAGITTVVDWSDIRSDDGLAGAALQAHTDAGLRSVFVHVPDGTQDLDAASTTKKHVARLADAAGPLTTVAFGAVQPEGPISAGSPRRGHWLGRRACGSMSTEAPSARDVA